MGPQRADFDHHMMGIALRLAAQGLGRTAPNPAVGAVIADERTGEVIARGSTQAGGRPHAEAVALARAGDRAVGATMYVTLEPCAHFGRTPPCADAVIAAGIRRLVCAIVDPDARVAGRGLARLREAGLQVERGLRAAEARWLTRGHIVRVTERRPFVQVKLALGADGSIARGTGGRPAWVTGPEARAQGHRLRAEADAILVGRQTVIDDGPELTCRLPGMFDRSPVRLVLTSDGGGLAGTRLFASAASPPVWVFCSTTAPATAVAELESRGARVFPVPRIGSELWLPTVMEALVGEGITRLLVEGGPTIWAAFARAGLVDEVVLFMSGRPRPETAHAALARYVPTTGLGLADQRRVGGDVMFMWRRAPEGKV
jgi:diaminohydroxyphosphoribosylaminopyrimidine deaminase / 5-amino-6-(5-phosphoribosylamino)uracil reductase